MTYQKIVEISKNKPSEFFDKRPALFCFVTKSDIEEAERKDLPPDIKVTWGSSIEDAHRNACKMASILDMDQVKILTSFPVELGRPSPECYLYEKKLMAVEGQSLHDDLDYWFKGRQKEINND